MKEWKLDPKKTNEGYPNVILQKYANSLTTQTDGILSGQVTESISNDTFGLPHIIYAFHVYLAKIKQSYRLFEVEQIKETVYPVNLKVFFYTGMEEHNNIKTSTLLEKKLDSLIISPGVSLIINHFINLSSLKDEEKE